MKRLLPAALAAVVGLGAALVPASAEAVPRRTSAIVFISDRDSPVGGAVQDDVYLYDTRTRTTSRLTDTPDAETLPVLSPSGRYLAYGRFDGIEFCRLRRADDRWTCPVVRRTTFQPLSTGRFAWTPDERSLVYVGQPTPADDTDIYSVRLSGLGRGRNLTQEGPAETPTNDQQPAVSPDGRFVVYSRDGDLWRRRIDGSRPVRLTNTPAPAVEFGAAYSPDGRWLAFHSNRKAPSSPATDDFDVYVMRLHADGTHSTPRDVTAALRAPDGGASRERFPTFSPDGTRLAFWWSVGGGQADFDDGEIFTIRTDGTDPTNITANNPADPDARRVGDILPSWGFVRR